MAAQQQNQSFHSFGEQLEKRFTLNFFIAQKLLNNPLAVCNIRTMVNGIR